MRNTPRVMATGLIGVVMLPPALAAGEGRESLPGRQVKIATIPSYAMIHNYYVVAVGCGNMIDFLGRTIKDVQKPREQQFVTTIELDRTLIHTNFNEAKVAKLLTDHKHEVVQEQYFDMEAWYLLRATKPGVRVRELCKQYGIETLRQYRQRSREQINDRRRKGEKV